MVYCTFSIKWEFDKMGIWSGIFFRIAPKLVKNENFLLNEPFFVEFCHFILDKMGFSQKISQFPSTRNENGIPFYRERTVDAARFFL